MDSLGVAGSAATGLLVIVILFSLLAKKKEKNAPPVLDTGLPIIGTIKTFMKFGENPVQFLRDVYVKHKTPVFTLSLPFGYNFTFLLSPEAQYGFYAANDHELSQKEPYRFMNPIFGKGLVFDAPNNIKAEQLRFISGALRKQNLRSYTVPILAETEAFLDGWGDSGEVDLLDEMSKLVIRTAVSALLGPEIRAVVSDNFSDLFREIDEGITPIGIINPNLPIERFRRRDAARAKFAEIFSSIIQKRRLEQAKGAPKPEDMLQTFMDSNYRDGNKLSDDQITGMIIGTIFAGSHTSAATSTWLPLKILENPALYERVMAEQAEFIPTSDKTGAALDNAQLNFDSLGQMDLLHLCMKEVLRLYPPLIMLIRCVKLPIQSMGYTIPEGHYVFAAPSVSMTLPEGPDSVFTKPMTFDPDRYTEGRAEDQKKKYAYSAFGGGIHACLGEAYGFIQNKVLVSCLLRNFEIENISGSPQPDYRAMVVGPQRPCRIRYKRRTTPYVPKTKYEPIKLPSMLAK